jgi:exosortase
METTSPKPEIQNTENPESWKIGLGSLALLAPWLLLIFQLSITWETNEQYAHGYLVPILCLFLILKTYPPATEVQTVEKGSPLQGKLVLIIALPVLLAFFPVWLVRGANSDWRMINFVLFLLTILYTFALLYDDGGWKRIRPLIFPFLFFLVAIPWPLKTDLQLTQWLQSKVSSIIVDILLLMEHQARLEGTVIDVGVFGKIGVDQACSGINGLQSSLVVTLFLGAYYGFGWINRLFLILSGMLLALALNLCRAFSLSFIKIKGKGHLLDDSLFTIAGWGFPSIHDLLGWIETGCIFVAILLLARMAKGGLFLTTMANEPNRWLNLRYAKKPWLSLAFAFVFVAIVFGVEAHYRSTESKMSDSKVLSLSLDDPSIKKEEEKISQQIVAQLHFESAESFKWQDRFRTTFNQFGQQVINPNSEYWQGFVANWETGGACTAVLSTHSPDSCLPLTGLTQISPPPGGKPSLIDLNVGGESISFEAYEFSRDYRRLFVFRCFWPHKIPAGQKNHFPSDGYNFAGRINSAINGERNVGGTMIALALANVNSMDEAISKLGLLSKDRLSLGQ